MQYTCNASAQTDNICTQSRTAFFLHVCNAQQPTSIPRNLNVQQARCILYSLSSLWYALLPIVQWLAMENKEQLGKSTNSMQFLCMQHWNMAWVCHEGAKRLKMVIKILGFVITLECSYGLCNKMTILREIPFFVKFFVQRARGLKHGCQG